MKSDNVLILPGWLNSGPDHWQSRWQAAHGYTRVEQHDWGRPLRGDWIARLEDVVLAQNADLPITLVAHSLGCLLVAAWAALSRNTHRVKCAFLVAPCDVALPALRPVLTTWRPSPQCPATKPTPPARRPVLLTPMPMPRQMPASTPTPTPPALPFKNVVLASRTDPHCSYEQAQALARIWGSTWIDCGARGHINAESGLGDWPEGHELLLALQREASMASETTSKTTVRRNSRDKCASTENPNRPMKAID